MPDLYDQIAKGSYGRTRDRWHSEPDFDETVDFSEDDETEEELLDIYGFGDGEDE